MTIFAGLELDERLWELRRAGTPVHVPPKALDLLIYLVRHRDRVATKDELLDHIWVDENVTESSLSRCVNTLRKCLQDDARAPRIIQTVRGRGFRFVAEAGAREGSTDGAGFPGARVPVEFVPRHEMGGRAATGFVGRGTELEQLEAAMDTAFGGAGRVVLVGGDAGIGKTRLVREITARARARGAVVTAGATIEGGAAAYWPWVEAIRELATGLDDATLTELMGPGAPELVQLALRQRFPSYVAPATVDGEQARYRLFDSVTALFARAAARHPVVLVLDDLHWADHSSLLLLQCFTRAVSRVPMLVLATYRDVEVGPEAPLTPVLTTLRREACCTRLVLGGLAIDAVRELTSAYARAPLSDGLIDRIARLTEGNPLFILETLDHLHEEGLLGTAESPDVIDTMTIPDGVRDIIGRRLARLSTACQRMLRLAAVLGGEFDFGRLERFGTERGESLLDLVEEAAAARIVAEVADTPGRYAFTHALIREVFYRGLGQLRRMHLHRDIGAALEREYAEDLEPHLSELAHHFAEAGAAGDRGKAVSYSIRAGERAGSLQAFEEAVRHYEAALHMTTDDARERCDLLLLLGDARAAAGLTARAHDAFGEAAAIARSLGDDHRLVQSALGHGGRHLRRFGGTDEGAVRLLEDALAHVPGDDTVKRSRLLARLAFSLRHAPDTLARRVALADEAVALGRASDDRAVLAAVLDDTLWAVWRADNLDARVQGASDLLALGRELGDAEVELRGEGWRFVSLLERGDIVAAERARAEHTRLAEALRLPIHRWDALNYRATHALLAGRLAEAEECASRAYGARPYVHPDNADQILGVQHGLVRFAQGRGPEIEAAVEGLIDRHPSCWRCSLAMLQADLGKPNAVRNALRRFAPHGFAALPDDSVRLASLTHLAVAASNIGDIEMAPLLHDALRPYTGRLIVVSEYGLACCGATEHFLGMLAATVARYDQAERYFRIALEVHERIGALPLAAETRYDHARMLRGRGRRTDRKRIRTMLAEALAVSERLGLGRLAARIGSDGGRGRSDLHASSGA